MRHMTIAAVVLPLLLVSGVTGATAQPVKVAGNPWVERRILNIAHPGGLIEAPSNTLYALKTARDKGADVLEIDVHATADRELVRPGLRHLPRRPAAAYALRGYATDERQLTGQMKKYAPNDFTLPTLREVLQEFPDELINIEIKSTAPQTTPYERELADLLAGCGRTDNTIVVSFLDHAVEAFKVHAPDVHTATGTGQTALFWATAQGPLPGAPNPRVSVPRRPGR